MPGKSAHVDLAGRSYEVWIGAGLLGQVGERIRVLSDAARAAIITDSTVATLYGAPVRASIERAGFTVQEIVVPAGETSKSWGQAGEVLEALAAAGLDRDDIVVALGGGVVGDLAGFCAATYLRGLAFVQLPTTLLAQVDSSVGGKTGVDLAAGKNLAGAFKQPLVVLADTDALGTLSESEWASGLAEVAKVAILESEERLAWTEANATLLSSRDAAATLDAVHASVAYKASVVTADEQEGGVRECLNFGHTLGHAIEKVAGYGTVPHGLAVAEGIRFAAGLAVDAVGASPEFAARQQRLLDALSIPRVRLAADAGELRGAMSSDKKARGGTPRFVLAVAPGQFVVQAVDEDLLRLHLRRYRSDLDERG